MKPAFRYLSYLIPGALLCVASSVLAADKSYLIVGDLPFIKNTTDLGSYLSGIFQIGIGIAVTLAVVMLVLNGIQYMFSDIPGIKVAAKNNLGNIIWGLLLAFSSWLILYTINPHLVKFDFITTINEAARGVEGPPKQPPTGGTCTNCVAMPESISCKNASSCSIAPSVVPKLQALDSNLGDENWQVTEGYPPTRVHADPCHKEGTCIDANFITDRESPSAERIGNFIDAAQRAGLGACYELSSQTRYDELRAAGIPANNILLLAANQISAPHFSVYSHKPSCTR